MSEPKRWSESGSEVDPVLRSMMRYSQAQEPTPEQVRQLVQAAQLADTPRPGLRRSARGTSRLRIAALGLAAMVASGFAWAGYQAFENARRPMPPGSVSAEPRLERAASHPRVATPTAPQPIVAPPEPLTEDSRPPPARSARRAPVPDDEISVLEEARRLLPRNPGAALALTRDHALRHPGGSFSEEREALAIEALGRLHRTDEAAARLRAFEAQYPHSPYRRRLGLMP